jgi:hypothetical protein
LPPEDVRRLQKFIDRHLALERTIGRYRLYRLEGN